MKIVRIRYSVPLGPMIQDLQRVFPNHGITAASLQAMGGIIIDAVKKRFVYVKEKFDGNGVRTHAIVITLVRDSFITPNWIQGTVISENDVQNPLDHYFLGHEVPMPDSPNESSEEQIA